MKAYSLANGGAVNGLVQSYDPLYTFPSYGTITTSAGVCDFINTGSGSLFPFTSSVSGTGATASNWVPNAVSNRIGIASIDTGTTTGGYAYVYGMNVAVVPGTGILRFRADLNIPTASDGTDTFTVRSGFCDGLNSGVNGQDGAFFRYTHSVNGGRWECVNRANSVENAVDSGVSAIAGAGVYQTLEIQINASATSALYYINGSLVATNSTNVPSGVGRDVGLGTGITKSAGTTNRSIYLDLMGYHYERSAAI